jgi:xanthine dehydrogenase small subunit
MASQLQPSPEPRDCIRFLLGDELRELRGFDPTLTVLDWLRGERRTGTKEGCNEGDCGACTVVVVRPEAGEWLSYRAVNACIQFVGTLDGCQLLTVEDLKRPGGVLHAVQQAMVECHGSQCGFCTPGVVMSLFAMLKTYAEPPTENELDDILAGNLCRCTGYAPIIRAAQRAYELHAADRFDAHDAQTLARLRALDDGRSVRIEGRGRSFHAPASTEDLADTLLRHPQATIIAGSTDVGLWVTKQMRCPDPLVHAGRVRALRRIAETEDGLEIGAAVPYAEAVRHLAALYPDLGELVRRLGSVQIRNMGTIGGNVANGSPIGDASPALIAAGATLHLRRGAEARSMPLERFFIAYGHQDRHHSEFVERITVPRPAPGTRFRAYKVSKRFDQDISAVMGAFLLRVEDGVVAEVRIAFGGMAGTPKRAVEAEVTLLGRAWDEATLRNAQDALGRDFQPIGDVRASAAYRMAVARNLLRRLLIETTSPDVETRLVGDRSLAHA